MNNSGNFADKWSRMFAEQADEVIAEDTPVRESVPMQVPAAGENKRTTLSSSFIRSSSRLNLVEQISVPLCSVLQSDRFLRHPDGMHPLDV